MERREPAVSIIVPCHNDGRFLPEALESIRACDDPRTETIIADDGSSDLGTVRLLDEVQQQGWKVLHLRHRGVSAARNAAIRQSRGRYLLPLDADNRIRPAMIREGIRILDSRPELGVVYGDAQHFGAVNGRWRQPVFDLPALLACNHLDTCAVFRRELWETCGGYDESMLEGYEDWDFWISAAGRGWNFIKVDELFFDYRVRDDSRNRFSMDTDAHLRVIDYLHRKHAHLYDLRPREVMRHLHRIRHELWLSEGALLRNREAERRCLTEESARAHESIREIRASLSWRMTAPLRTVGGWLMRRPAAAGGASAPAPDEIAAAAPKDAAASVPGAPHAATSLRQCHEIQLRHFLHAPLRLTFAQTERPSVSIILVLHNRADWTYACLQTLRLHLERLNGGYEVILVDNASTDETPQLLDRIDGVTVIRNAENRWFAPAVNAAAKRARGEHLLLLNNDTLILPGSVEAALEALAASPKSGAVGGRLIHTDGRLQEAGSSIWRDGSCQGAGRGDDPWDPRYLSRRPVDYCAGAFLLTPRELFLQMGGLDERFSPMYYEDTDYCVRLNQAGWKVIYEPMSAILHEEHGSGNVVQARNLMAEKGRYFSAKHAAWLEQQPPPPFADPDLQVAMKNNLREENSLPVDDPMATPERQHLVKGTIRPSARLDLDHARSFTLGEESTLETHSVVNNALGDVTIGRKCLIGIGTIVIGPVSMGDSVQVGQHALLTAIRHDYEDIRTPISHQPVSVNGIVVEKDVWIGANSSILPRVRIGQHSVVGAGSVVTKDVEPYTVVAGNPAKPIKRFDPATGSWVRCTP